MRALRLSGLVAIALLASGCTFSVHEYGAAGYAPTAVASGPPKKAVRIESKGEQFVILGVAGDTDYVDDAYRALQSQCDGEIVGVNTRYSTRLGFFSYTNEIQMRAMCLKAQ